MPAMPYCSRCLRGTRTSAYGWRRNGHGATSVASVLARFFKQSPNLFDEPDRDDFVELAEKYFKPRESDAGCTSFWHVQTDEQRARTAANWICACRNVS